MFDVVLVSDPLVSRRPELRDKGLLSTPFREGTRAAGSSALAQAPFSLTLSPSLCRLTSLGHLRPLTASCPPSPHRLLPRP